MCAAQVDYFAAQACTNCLWALAVLQGTALPAFDVLVEKLTGSRGWSSLQDVQQQQLFQVLLGPCLTICNLMLAVDCRWAVDCRFA